MEKGTTTETELRRRAMAGMYGGFWQCYAAANAAACAFYEAHGLRRDRAEPYPVLGHATTIYISLAMTNLSLRKWLRQEPTREEILHVFSEVGREQSPRAAALGAAVMVEVGLSSMLRARLWIKDDNADTELFGSAGPISTFSQKIKMAEAMRIIGPASRSNLDRIREIRNAFAHTHRHVTFDTPGVAALCDRITIEVWPRRPRMPPIVTPRDKYVYSSLGLFVILEEMAKHTRSKESGEFSNYPVRHWWGETYPAPLP